MSTRVVLVGGLAVIAVAVGVTLSRSPLRVAGTNSVTSRAVRTTMHSGEQKCQGGEVLPAGTTALRIALVAVVGPKVTITAISHGRVLTHGTRSSGWIGGNVTVPIPRVRTTTADVRICWTLGQGREAVVVISGPTPRVKTASHDTKTTNKMPIEYLAVSDKSWWSQRLTVARHIGLGRAPEGTWIVVLLLSLMAGVIAFVCRQVVHDFRADDGSTATPARLRAGRWNPLARMSPAACVCALVACLNAACWSILSPPFEIPDEPSHFAYVQQLAEAQELPTNRPGYFSDEEETATYDLRQPAVQFIPGTHTIFTRTENERLRYDLARGLSRRGSGYANVANSEPPLYYMIETIPYGIGSGGTLLDRLELMRLFSAILGGATAFFAFMFVRECLPGVRWAWTVGGLGVALAPLLGFMSGAVNPDAMVFALSAALFYLMARAFRRGLTRGLAVSIGAVGAAGALTKLNFLGLVPGMILGLVLIAFHAKGTSRRAALGNVAIAVAMTAGAVILYLSIRLTSVISMPPSATQHRSLLVEAQYIWQLFLPRLPGMTNLFPGVSTTRQLWFDGLVGMYGWVETLFPGWVDDLALVPAGLVAILCLRAVVTCRDALRRRILEVLVYAAMGTGVLVIVGAGSYTNDIILESGPFWQPRYLLPMLALLGAALALAARGAGRRWGPAAGTLIVLVFLAHDIFSQLLVVARYYG